MQKSLREDCLEKAIEVTARKREDYSEHENSFERIAKLWRAYLDIPVTAHDVCILLCLFKIARIKQRENLADSYIDLCGYGACAYEQSKTNSVQKDTIIKSVDKFLAEDK